MDRFAAIIHKQRLLAYPAGQWYQGVLFEMERNPAINVVYPPSPVLLKPKPWP